MTGDSSPGLYPRYCFELSPTHNTWCLMHVSDIRRLVSVPDYEAQDFYFYRNLPIKWVRVVGIVVAVDDYPGRRIYTVDDSSGACIECTVVLRTPSAAPQNQPNGQFGLRPQPLPPADCVDVDVGSVLDIKGGLTTFREEMQIKIDKVKVLRSTEQEVALWERRTQFRDEVLLEPWLLTDKQIRRCKRQQEDGDDDDERRRKKREKRREEKKRAAEEEEKRRKAAAEAEVANRYRYHKMRKSQKAQERGAGASSTLLRHVLDENMRGKYNALGL